MSWPLVHLKDGCSFMTGGTPSTKDDANYVNGDIPWIVSGDIHLGEIFCPSKRITPKGMDDSPAKFLPKNSVLIALNGQGKTRATVALLRISGATCNQSIVAIIPRSLEILDYHYLFVTLRSMYQQLRDLTGHENRAGLNMGLIGKVQIPLPPLAEQKRIAAILDTADALRAKRRESLAHLDTLVQSTFLGMFGDPVTNPMGWEVVNSSELFLVPPRIGTTTPAAGQGHLVVRVGEVGQARIAFELCGRVEICEKDFKKFKLEPGDTVIARAIGSKSQLGKASFFSGLDEAVVIDSHVMRFRPDATKCNGVWFYSLISSDRGKVLLQQAGGATAVQFNINAKQASSLLVALPPLDLQHRFAACVESVEQQKPSRRNHLAELDTLFASLQSRAFRGDL